MNLVDTTRRAVPYQTANIPGPKTARPVKPDVAARTLAKAKRPLLITGSKLDEGAAEKACKLGEHMTLAATGNSYKALRGAYYINFHALTSYLSDKDWPGFDGGGGYDVVAVMGVTYYYASQLLAALKNFTSIKTVSLDRHYHPNAVFSFGNLKEKEYLEALDQVIEIIAKEKKDKNK